MDTSNNHVEARDMTRMSEAITEHRAIDPVQVFSLASDI